MAAPRQIELIRKNDPNEEKALINPDFQQHRSISIERFPRHVCYAFDCRLLANYVKANTRNEVA
jgi:hypothetical protein